jgi:hypothetical protein
MTVRAVAAIAVSAPIRQRERPRGCMGDQRFTTILNCRANKAKEGYWQNRRAQRLATATR